MRHDLTPPDMGRDNTKTNCCQWLKTVALLTGAAIGAAVAVNKLIALRTPPPDDRLGGLFARYPGRLGDLAYTVSGDGPPVLLLHSLNPGASMAEWAGNFSALAQHFTVYALDFLGWGASDKPSALYNTAEYAEQIEFFIEDVIGEPCAVIASGHSASAALRAANRQPKWISNLILICPPVTDKSEGTVSEILSGPRRAQNVALGLPVIGASFYNFLVSRRALGESARQQFFFDKNHIDESAINGWHIAAHQPGARHAARGVWAGLADYNALSDWEKLSVPALLVWGRNALQPPVDTAPEWLALKPDAHLEVLDQAMLLPHAEHPERFNELATDWLSRS